MVLVWVHVDHGCMMGLSEGLLDEVEAKLTKRLKIRWSRVLEHTVGIDVKHLADGLFQLSQPGLVRKVLSKHLETGGVVRTPFDPKDMPVKGEKRDELVDRQMYLSVIGMLKYLLVATRPDVTYAKFF